jgi:hypothetical protein
MPQACASRRFDFNPGSAVQLAHWSAPTIRAHPATPALEMKNYFRLQGVAPRRETITETRESERPAAKLHNSRNFSRVSPR